MAEQMIKVHRINKPDEIRHFTKQAWDYIKGPTCKWVEDGDQTQPEEPKKRVVAPAAIVDKKPGLREEYKNLTGNEADAVWNEARLSVEIAKASRTASIPPSHEEKKEEVSEKVEAPAEAKPKRKYTKRQKAEA